MWVPTLAPHAHLLSTTAPNETIISTDQMDAPDSMRIACGWILFGMSVYGVVVNMFMFHNFMLDPQYSSEFHKLCASKTVSNTGVCFCHLVWASPCTILGMYYLDNDTFGLAFSQLGAVYFYLVGGLVQICMASNRFLIITFPARFNNRQRHRIAMTMMVTMWLMAILSLPVMDIANIVVKYDYKTLGYHSADYKSSTAFFLTQLTAFVVMILTSNAFNVATSVRLIKSAKQNKGISTNESLARRKRNLHLFFQNVAQDCIPLIDTIDTFVANAYCKGLMTLFSSTFTLVLGHLLDGTVMMIFSKSLQNVFCPIGNRKKSTTKVTMISSTN